MPVSTFAHKEARRPPETFRSRHNTVQPKLEIGKPGDKYEKEADAVADRVMRMPTAPAPDSPMAGTGDGLALQTMRAIEAGEQLQMECEECEEEESIQMMPSNDGRLMMAANPGDEEEEDTLQMKARPGILRAEEEEEETVQMKTRQQVMRVEDEEETVQMSEAGETIMRAVEEEGDGIVQPEFDNKAASNGKRYASDTVSGRIRASKGGGRPLAPHTRAEMSSKIGADFSAVRVHTDVNSARLNRAIGAKAFTHGSDIYFNKDQYNPSSPEGKHLLAHELTHTVQQGAAVQTKPAISRTQPKVQGLFQIVRDRLNEYARYIPGWTLFTVVIGYNPLLGRSVDRNAENLVGGLLELLPVFGVLLMDKLREHNILTDAFNWVRDRLNRLDLSLERLERTIDNAYEDMEFLRLDPVDYNIRVLRRHFTPLLNDVTTFVGEIADHILEMIKDALMTALKAIADAVPGYPLLTKILGRDPLTGEEVVSTTAEKIEDFLVLIGKERELEKMREEGTIQETADWLDGELERLDFSIEEIIGLFETAWDAFSMEDLRDPVAAFNRTVAIFQPFVSRVFTFAYNVGSKVLEIIKNALLSQLSAFAREQRGYHLLTVLLGRDPFTGDAVERNVENIIRGFMSLMDGGEAQFQQMKETGAIEQTTERVNAAVEELGFTLDYIVGLFIGLWNSFTIEDIFNPIGAFRRIVDTLGGPLRRLFTFVVRIVRIVIEVLLEVMNFPTETITNIINNAMQAFEDIKRDPIGFLKNLLRAVKEGFTQFFDNIVTHLLNGLRDWLFGELASAGIQPPADLSFRSILGFVLDTLGISIENVWERLALKIGPERVAQIRGAIDTLTGIWTFIKDVYERGPIAIWEYIQEQLSNLWDMMLGMIKDWIMDRIITQVTTRLMTMLDPTGIMTVVNGFITFYRAVQSFIEKLREMLEIVNSFVAGVANIARGDTSLAADYLENALARGVPVAIGFLANQVGLRGLGQRISDMIGGLREKVNAAIDWLIDKALRIGGALLSAARSAAGAVSEAISGLFGGRRTFRTESGESHSVFVEERGGRPQVMIASNPQPLTEFLDFYESQRGDSLSDTKREHLSTARNFISNEINPVIQRLQNAEQDGQSEEQIQALQQELLDKESRLADTLRLLLSGDRNIGQTLEKYALEGLTGTYGTMPKPTGDDFTADHQPQAAILEEAAEMSWFREEGVVNMRNRAARRANAGYAINLHKYRHEAGRTYGSKGSRTKNQFLSDVSSRTSDDNSAAENRRIVVNLIKRELSEDVDEMKAVVNTGNTHDNWKDIHQETDLPQEEKDNLINDVRNRINSGENRLAAQDVDSLAN